MATDTRTRTRTRTDLASWGRMTSPYEDTITAWETGKPEDVSLKLWRRQLDRAARWTYSEAQRAALQASDDYQGERVMVARGPGHARVAVPTSRLAGWHVATRLAGGRFLFPRPMIAAYMLCTDIPEETRAAFGHLCLHGSGPHLIRVVILPRGARLRAATVLLRRSRWVYAVRGSNRDVSRRLRKRAERRHAITGSVRGYLTPPCSLMRKGECPRR